MITINSKPLEWTKGMTVASVLRAMNYNFPLIAVTVNDDFVAPEDFESYQVEDNAEVKALHICHGG